MTVPSAIKSREPSQPALVVTSSESVTPHDQLPELKRDGSFWGMAATQFLGAFNDNLFKQLVLLLSIAAGAAGASDRQGLAMFIFTVPFLVFTGYAGYLADRLSKRAIVVACKVAEIGVMALGAVAFATYASNGGLWPLYAVLFLMGAHSAFFGPAKYGILPEMLRARDLPRANGFLLMSTFLAIIFGTVIAGFLLRFFGDRLWVASLCCMSIAVAGLLTALFVRRVRPSNPHLKFELAAITVPHDMRALLRQDRPLLAALLVSSVFWLLAGMMPAAVNALGEIELKLGPAWTSVLTGAIGIGIAIGCVIGGLVSGGEVDFRLVRVGSIGMLLCLALLAVPASGDPSALIGADGKLSHLPRVAESAQWLGFFGSLPTLLALGAFTGFFAVPLQVFMQCRPPDGKKGRMIAVMNQANWIGVLISAGLYQALALLLEACHWSRSLMFVFIALLMLPVAILYHPKNERLADASA
jgi:acyl-[acyl-carrier-protein]-phospholipid O-acyltransferase/long-chain-fatty-acid--[acyl-carrier-protein] ligase